MSVNFHVISPAFKCRTANKNENSGAHHVCPDCGQVIHCDNNEVEKKKGFFTRLKNGFINIRKGFIDFGYILGGTIKGALYGAASAAGVAGIAAIRNIAKNAPQKLGIGGKILAATTGIAVMGGTIFKSKLDANEAKSKLDHRWETGHNEG